MCKVSQSPSGRRGRPKSSISALCDMASPNVIVIDNRICNLLGRQVVQVAGNKHKQAEKGLDDIPRLQSAILRCGGYPRKAHGPRAEHSCMRTGVVVWCGTRTRARFLVESHRGLDTLAPQSTASFTLSVGSLGSLPALLRALCLPFPACTGRI